MSEEQVTETSGLPGVCAEVAYGPGSRGGRRARRAPIAVAVLAVLVGTGLVTGNLMGEASAGATPHPPRLFAVGHSWVVGTSSGEQIGYADALVRQERVTRIDADQIGYTARQVSGLLDAAPLCRVTDFAVLQVGLNDIRRFGDAGLPRYRRAMRHILDRLHRCPVVLVQEPGALNYRVIGAPLRGNDSVVADYRLATARIAETYDNVTLVGPMLGRDDYLEDGLHPDLSGNRTIARVIRATRAWHGFVQEVSSYRRNRS